MFSLTQGLRRAVQTRPRHASTCFATRRRTWEQTIDRVARVAGALSALGVQRGDRVAILALNSDRYFELMYAIPWIGAALVPLNTRLAAPEIEYILNDSGSVALFIDGTMAHHLTSLDGKTPTVREVIWIDDIASPEGMLHYEDLTAYESAEDAGAADDDLAGLFYTGGTTGRSKGVMLTHTNLVVNAMNAVAVPCASDAKNTGPQASQTPTYGRTSKSPAKIASAIAFGTEAQVKTINVNVAISAEMRSWPRM